MQKPILPVLNYLAELARDGMLFMNYHTQKILQIHCGLPTHMEVHSLFLKVFVAILSLEVFYMIVILTFWAITASGIC